MPRLTGFLLILCFGCSSPQPKIGSYVDFDGLLDSQVKKLSAEKLTLKKDVKKDQVLESATIEMDSAAWENEFRLLRDFNPADSRYVGAFDITEETSTTIYILKPDQPAALKSFEYRTSGDSIIYRGLFEEDKTIYTHRRIMELLLINDRVERLKIEVTQVKYPQDSLIFTIESSVLH